MEPADRKREPPDSLEGQPHTKRLATSLDAANENVDPKDTTVLLYQNTAMQIRIKEMRMELSSHEYLMNQFTEKQRLFDETLSCANRTWDQLNENAHKLLSRLNFNYDGVPKGQSPGTNLVHLLMQKPEPLHDVTEFDDALQQRVTSTQQLLDQVVNAVEKERANNENITALFRDQAPDAIQQRLKQLEAENMNLTNTINKLQESQQNTNNTYKHTENQNRSYVQQIEDLHTKIYHLETDLSQTRRKVIKQELPLPVGVIAQPRTPATTTSTSITTTTNSTTLPNGTTPPEAQKIKEETAQQNQTQGQNGTENGHEMSDLMAVAEGRLEEAARLREEKVALLRENTRLQEDLSHLSVERIAGSEPYKRLDREIKIMREHAERDKEMLNRLRLEINQTRDGRKKERETVEREEAARRKVMEAQLKELQETVTKLKFENYDIQSQIEQRMASLPSEKYIAELKELVAARDSDIKKLKDECEKLNALNKNLNERKGDKMEETLQSKLIEINELQDKLRRIERDLDDYARREKSWQSREKDYRNMVDSFQSSSKDRRELHELRSAERRLRDDVDDLRREKDELRRVYDKSQRAEAVRDLEKKQADEVKTIKTEHEKLTSKSNFQIKELKSQLDSKTQDYDVMMSEVDSISQAYEDMQAQNKRLLQELGNKEDVTIQVASEGMKMKRQLEQARIEARDRQDRYNRAEDRNLELQAYNADLKIQIGEAHLKFSKAFDDLQGMGLAMDSLRREARDAQVQAAEFKLQADNSEAVYTETRRKVEELVTGVEKEKEKAKRFEEDKASLKRKLDRALPLRGGSSSGGVNYHEEELRALKQKLTCLVCNDRLKDTVISKCFHVFCHECVATNLQIRKRRCPQCQAPFSSNDVHNLYGFV